MCGPLNNNVCCMALGYQQDLPINPATLKDSALSINNLQTFQVDLNRLSV